MPKFKKEKKKESISNKKAFDEIFAYKTVIKSALFAGVFFIISILFNMEIVNFFMDQGGLWLIIDITIKVLAILLFFFFIVISVGNYKELTGKPLKISLILFMSILSILQAFRNPIVLIFTIIGLIIIIIYMFIIQEI